jgi:transketolase
MAPDMAPQRVLDPPYRTVLKPYGRALAELARHHPEIVCLTGDLTRQCEIDLFQAEFPDRFIHAGMAEANMIGVAGALARQGLMPWVHSFGVFATRRPLDQIVSAVAYPGLPVRLVGFMPGISSPGGPSHQAIEDVALMRALPNMTVIDVADATETAQAVTAMAGLPGPAYLRLKRGEIPVIFPEDHQFSVAKAQILATGDGGERTDAALIATGMMVAPALAAAETLNTAGVATTVVNVPVIKPLDTATVLAVAAAARVVVTAENHSVIGGLGSAVAETLAESGLGRPLRRIGLQDTFAEGAKDAPYLFTKYGLTVQHLIDTTWTALHRPAPPPRPEPIPVGAEEYSPV